MHADLAISMDGDAMHPKERERERLPPLGSYEPIRYSYYNLKYRSLIVDRILP